MIESKNFKTKTVILPRQNVWTGNNWLFALDVGYSGTKAFSPNCCAAFPSYARKVEGTLLPGETKPDDILYKDEKGTLWRVGESAQTSIKSDDAQDSEKALYGRNRYSNPMFKVITETGLGIQAISNNFRQVGNGTNYLQTGLPPKYIDSDTEAFNEVLTGEHKFSLKIGSGRWQDFDIFIAKENILPMFSQPMGSLYSALLKPNAKFTDDAKKILSSNVLTVDGGFVTLDTCPIIEREVEESETFDNYGMKEVLARTASAIQSKYGIEIPVYAMQKYLQTGQCKKFNPKLMKTETVDFTEMLNKYNEEVCMESLKKLKNIYNYFLDYQYILLTGGTGAAWFPIIKNHLSQMDELAVIGANRNEDLSHIFSNVRGYYLFAYRLLKSEGLL